MIARVRFHSPVSLGMSQELSGRSRTFQSQLPDHELTTGKFIRVLW